MHTRLPALAFRTTVLFCIPWFPAAQAQDPAPHAQELPQARPRSTAVASEWEPGALFARVAKTLSSGSGGYYDKAFRRETLPGLIERYEPLAQAAHDLAAERVVVDGFLSEIPASHLALWTTKVYRHHMNELGNKKQPMLGFEVEQHASRFVVYRLYDGSPAAEAGLRRGDRVLAVDGVPIHESPRLAGSSDDAHLDDPPMHYLEVADGDEVALKVERRPGEKLTIRMVARKMCGMDAARASARVIDVDGRRVGYVHFWFMHFTGPAALLKELIEGDFADCDGLILDMRGRGGNAMEPAAILALISGKRAIWQKPVVTLVDRASRSAKEAFAYDFRKKKAGTIVGERTAGALVPASFQDVGFGYTLMYPAMKLGEWTTQVELKGVEPDVFVADAGVYAAGADPILDAGLRTVVAAGH